MIKSLYVPFQKWSEKGTVWVYSDPHFNDNEVSNYNRMSDEDQVKSINSKVGKNDTLIILGDIGDVAYIRKLRGYKILIKGNHDSGSTNYSEYFDEIYSGPLFVAKQLILSHEPIDLQFAFNIHGHVHTGSAQDNNHLNVCSNIINYIPINFNQFMKSGFASKLQSIHRVTINKATERKLKRIKNK